MVTEELPVYDALLASHHYKEAAHTSRRQRGTNDWLLVATLSGEGRFGSPTKEIEVFPGMLTLVAPGTPHDYGTARQADGWEILWVHFHPRADWLEYLAWPEVTPGIATLAPDKWPDIVDQFHEVCRLSTATGRLRRQIAMNALERLLLECAEELPETGLPMDPRIRASIDFIHSHLRDSITLELLGSRACLSPSRFAHLFRSETGMAPLQYANLQKMDRARTLLERTTLSVGEVAAEIGMDPFHFSARFKAQVGVSPRAYRARFFLNQE